VPPDVAAGGAGGGEGDAVLDGDLVGVAPTVTSAVLRAWVRPTWIFCPPTMIAPRTDAKNKLAVTSICHNSIGAGRSHRRYCSRRLRRGTGSISWWRTSTR